MIKINKVNLDKNQDAMIRMYAPGKVMEITDNEIIVLCNPGLLSITNLTMPGKKPNNVSSLVKGNFKIEPRNTFRNE
jgi:methionyl-tRNA formyltransferase